VFSAPHLCSLHISMVLIVAPKSTVDISFRTPPTVLPLTGGGGGGLESLIRPARIWTAQDRARRSTVNIGFRTPPSVLPLMEGGGGPECVIKGVQRSAARKQALRSMAQNVFRTPPTDLLLTGGGGPEWFSSSGGSLFIRGSDLMAPSPIIPYYLTDLVTSRRHHPPFPK
jgi:hypothetical protein